MNSLKIPTKITEELAEEVGLHIGDGTMGFYNNHNKVKGSFALRGHITEDKQHYNTRIKYLYKRLYSLTVSLHDMPSTGCYGFQLWSDNIVNYKNKLGLPLGPKEQIFIPEIFLNPTFSKAVVRGIYDTDGCLYLEPKRNKLYPRIKIAQSSRILAIQIKEILTENSIRATLYTDKRKNTSWEDLHIIEVRGYEHAKLFLEEIRPYNQKHLRKWEHYLSSQKGL